MSQPKSKAIAPRPVETYVPPCHGTRRLSNELFKSLIKLGAQWQGDIHNKQWTEYLYLPAHISDDRLADLLDYYLEGIDYTFNDKKTGIYI